MSKIKKNKFPPQSPSGIRLVGDRDAPLRFSFSYFDITNDDVCPDVFPDGYTRCLMQRLQDLSKWKVSEFTGATSQTVRNHRIVWEETSKKDGFTHLNEQMKAYTPYQFSLTANQHGRVHGILMGDTFQVIWLDRDHGLYSKK